MTDTQPQAEKRPPRQEQEAASEAVTEVAPGVLRMQLPIWMPGLGHVNMYALEDDRGLAVVDPGLPGPQSWKALKRRLNSAGYRLDDIHTVVVTHSDTAFSWGDALIGASAALLIAFAGVALLRRRHPSPLAG